jgi:two-component system OmpR family response regulator
MTSLVAAPLVLLVADDRVVRDEASDFLERHGLTVRAVRDGERALALAEGHIQPDVVVVDLLLSTVESYRMHRAAREAFGVPIILVTPFVSRIGGSTYDELERPLNPATLLARIATVLARA